MTTDAKAFEALKASGILAFFKRHEVTSDDGQLDDKAGQDKELVSLKGTLRDKIDEIQALLTGGVFNADTTCKLNDILTKLQGALQGSVSRATLSAMLAEAISVLNTIAGYDANLTPQQRKEQLWQQIDHYNNAIDDNFEQMCEAGVTFDKKLWNERKALKQYMLEHPHDETAQKQLMAIEKELNTQADEEIKEHPERIHDITKAREVCGDQKENIRKREIMNRKLEQEEVRKTATSVADSDWDNHSPTEQGKNVTMDNVASQRIGLKQPGKSNTLT